MSRARTDQQVPQRACKIVESEGLVQLCSQLTGNTIYVSNTSLSLSREVPTYLSCLILIRIESNASTYVGIKPASTSILESGAPTYPAEQHEIIMKPSKSTRNSKLMRLKKPKRNSKASDADEARIMGKTIVFGTPAPVPNSANETKQAEGDDATPVKDRAAMKPRNKTESALSCDGPSNTIRAPVKEERSAKDDAFENPMEKSTWKAFIENERRRFEIIEAKHKRHSDLIKIRDDNELEKHLKRQHIHLSNGRKSNHFLRTFRTWRVLNSFHVPWR